MDKGCKVILCLRCCWPGCTETAEYAYYYGIWADCKWRVQYPHNIVPGRSLCPLHNDVSFDDLAKMEDEANAMGTL
jgi:hypothetical protein